MIIEVPLTKNKMYMIWTLDSQFNQVRSFMAPVTNMMEIEKKVKVKQDPCCGLSSKQRTHTKQVRKNNKNEIEMVCV